MSSSIQENTIGAPLTFTVLEPASTQAMDISLASVKNLIFKKPNGVRITKTNVPFATDGTDGKLKYITIDGDLAPAGKWAVQAYIVKPGIDGRTKEGLFDVLRNL